MPKKSSPRSVPAEGLTSPEVIHSMIFIIRGKKVMLSTHLAGLYDVQSKVLVQAVKRNIERFPADFMFQLTKSESANLRSQIVTSSSRSQFVTLKRGQNIKYSPYAFTEQGVAMLSSVLNSERAIQVNIGIMRAFTRLREIIDVHKDFRQKLEELEQRVGYHDKKIMAIVDMMKKMFAEPKKQKIKIGFHTD